MLCKIDEKINEERKIVEDDDGRVGEESSDYD